MTDASLLASVGTCWFPSPLGLLLLLGLFLPLPPIAPNTWLPWQQD